MKGFRFYSEFRSDPKMCRMPIQHRYAFIVLLCLANDSVKKGAITGLDDEDLAFEMEMSLEEWRSLKEVFRDKGLIDFAGDGVIVITNWDKRQNPDFERPSADKWRVLRDEVFARDGYTCQYCGDRGTSLQCDHIIPVSRGGSNDLTNLQTACKKCNQSKHNKTISEWGGSVL